MPLSTITPNNRYMISVDNDGSIYVTERETMSTVYVIKSQFYKVTYIGSFPDNQHFIISDRTRYDKDEDYLHVFDLQSGKCINICTFKGVGVGKPFITPDSQHVIFTTGFKYSVAIWDWQVGSEIRILFSQGLEECFIQTLNSDGSKVVVTHYPAIAPPVIKKHQNPILRIWDLQTGQNICSFPGYIYVKVLPDKHKIMAMKEETRILAVLDIENGWVDSVLDNE